MTLTKKSLVFSIVFFSTILPKNFIDQLGPPWGYVFDEWAGDPLDVIVYIPNEARANIPILIIIPGASRDAQRFHGSWLDLAKKHKFAVVTIGARKKYFPDEYAYNAGGVITDRGGFIKEDKWLFSAIAPLFNDLKDRYGFTSEKFYLFGHSAGGGFVHRYLLLKPDAPVIKAVAANPAFVTLPENDVEYPFGIRKAPLKTNALEKWLKHNLAIILGEEDLGPRTKLLSNGPMARKQGPNCLTRGKLLYSSVNSEAKELDIKCGWDLITVPGVGHDNFNIAPVACEYLFGKQ